MVLDDIQLLKYRCADMGENFRIHTLTGWDLIHGVIMTTEITLLPCPFCGGEPEISEWAPENDSVHCPHCFCFGPVFKDHGDPARAVEGWNNRHV